MEHKCIFLLFLPTIELHLAKGNLNRPAASHLVVYHLMDKVALVIIAVLGYYTGKYHLNDEILFLWLMAAMPIAMLSVIWAINELPVWLGKRKSKSRWY